MPLCPECGHEVTATDTHCMGCGADLIAAKERARRTLREQSHAARTGGGSGATRPPANPAAAGTVGVGEKSSDETRLRQFDKQEAGRLAQERTTAWVTAAIALVAGAFLLVIGLGRIKLGGGFGEILPAFKPATLRHDLFAPIVVGTAILGMGVSGLLAGIGQIRLAMAAGRAIEDVKNRRKPEIAQVSTFTLLGLFLLCIFCPPLGLVIGLLMRFGRNPDLRSLGGNMVTTSVVIIALVGLNTLWQVFENMKPAPAPKVPK